jgi:hypothetical protein
VITSVKVSLWYGYCRDKSCSGRTVVRVVTQVTSPYVILDMAMHLIRQKFFCCKT